MPKFAANLSFIFQEVGFLERFAAAAACGFQGIEYLSPYEYPPEVIAEQLKRHGLEQALFNMPPGDWAAGERGIAALPGREQEFRDGVETALTYAKATNCRLVHAMAGLVPEGSDRAAAQRAYVANLRHAAERLAPESVTVVIEPINNRDIPGYYLNTTTQAMQVIGAVGHPNLKLQLDLYHVQIMEGDLAHRIRALAGHYPHVHGQCERASWDPQTPGTRGSSGPPTCGNLPFAIPALTPAVSPVGRSRQFGTHSVRPGRETS